LSLKKFACIEKEYVIFNFLWGAIIFCVGIISPDQIIFTNKYFIYLINAYIDDKE
jgi:hypothetical protein